MQQHRSYSLGKKKKGSQARPGDETSDLFFFFWLEKILLDFKKQNEVTKKAQEWMSLGSVVRVSRFSRFLWHPSAFIPSTITIMFKQGRNHWVSAGNMWYFQTRRKSLKLGSASMCHSKAHFILSCLHLVWSMLSGTACDTRIKEPEKPPYGRGI